MALHSDSIEKSIILVRGHRVMLDAVLARLYGVTTKRLNEQVRRNLERFPTDFMFQLTKDEFENLRSQFATSSLDYGGRRYAPYVFTEHGAVMLASVLNSPIAVNSSIQVVRAFISLRQILSTNKDLADRISKLEQKYDYQFKGVFDAIRQLMLSPNPSRRKIGIIRED